MFLWIRNSGRAQCGWFSSLSCDVCELSWNGLNSWEVAGPHLRYQTSRDLGLEFSECHFFILLSNASHRPDQFKGWGYKYHLLIRKGAFANQHRRHSWQPALVTVYYSFQEVIWYAKHYSWDNARRLLHLPQRKKCPKQMYLIQRVTLLVFAIE